MRVLLCISPSFFELFHHMLLYKPMGRKSMNRKIRGLSNAEVLTARKAYGSNALTKIETKGLFRRFLDNLSDPIIRILLIATALRALFSFGDRNWIEIGGILLAIFIAATVTTFSEWGSEKAFKKMSDGESQRQAAVFRDGRVLSIPESDVVVGDTVYLDAGKSVPADGIMIDGSLSVNQSALNGEAAEVKKHPSINESKEWRIEDEDKVYRGSVVTNGSGFMRVGRVGENTFYGAVAVGVQSQTRESPLKLRLSKLASQISRIGYAMAALVALTNLFFTFIVSNDFSAALIIEDIKNTPFLLSSLLHAFSLMLTVVVVAVPEGLPMMITVLLSSNMHRMQKDGVLVKKMVGIETAGSMNILFTDKTGTLTSGMLSVESFFTSDCKYRSINALKRNQILYSSLCLSAKYNTDVYRSENGSVGGNQTERAISDYFAGEQTPDAKLNDRISFDSEKKYSRATLNIAGERISLIKGAPEIIASMCDKTLASGERRGFSSIEKLLSVYRSEAQRGKRVLAFALKKEEEEKYTFLCFCALRDKLRMGVKEAVEEVKNAGVQVVMITGDGMDTACYIASECGILNSIDKRAIISGEELRSLRSEELAERIPYLRVVYRALPDDKMRLVQASQSIELVVGMTGDGINDASALKNADIGFAMGSGTEIAKSAADIVLLNDHFSAIGKTILYGRTIFHSIRKFVSFQLIMNLAACGVSFLGQFIGIENPITIVQMLWVNMIMDTLGGLAFAGEPPLRHYMCEKPKKRDEAILTKEMIRKILVIGGFTLSICVLYLNGSLLRTRFDAANANSEFLTGFYALFIFIGLFNCLHTRSERFWIFHGIVKNKGFLLILSGITAIQLLIIYRGGEIFRCVPLSAGQLLAIGWLSFSVIPFDFFYRCLVKLTPNTNKHTYLPVSAR